MKTCPFCAEEIQDAAVVCKHCGRELTASSSAARPAMPSLPTARIPGARVFAKTCHLLALGWTAFCIVSVMVGMAAASNSLGGELSGAAAIGVGIGLGFWAFVWFVPVVGLEVVVLTATVTAKQVPADHGTSKREWQRAFLFCAAPNLLLLLAIFASIGSSTSSSPTKRSGHDASRSGQSEVVGITMDKFTQLRDGMSYSEVVAILGQSGKELSRSSIAGTTTVMYSWEGWGIANMNAMFQDDRMISKAQFGLR
jgi:hypothetical protein